MTPTYLLIAMAGVTLGAWFAQAQVRHRHKQGLRRRAREWELRYNPDDLFELAAELGGKLPEVGAADVCVRDVLYRGDEGSGEVCLFTVEYTLGTVGGQRRLRRVGSMADAGAQGGELVLAKAQGILDGYDELRPGGGAKGAGQ